jgi:hypothetical protein
MTQLDPYLLGVFRSRMCDPACFRRVFPLLCSFRYEDLRNPAGAALMVDRLSATMGVPA